MHLSLKCDSKLVALSPRHQLILDFASLRQQVAYAIGSFTTFERDATYSITSYVSQALIGFRRVY